MKEHRKLSGYVFSLVESLKEIEKLEDQITDFTHRIEHFHERVERECQLAGALVPDGMNFVAFRPSGYDDASLVLLKSEGEWVANIQRLAFATEFDHDPEPEATTEDAFVGVPIPDVD